MDNGREEISLEESGTDGEEEEDEEVEVITATPLRLPRLELLAKTPLALIGIHVISGFGQLGQLVVMTPTSVASQTAAETQAIPEALAEAHLPPMETTAPEVTMELARETFPKAGAKGLVPDTEMDTKVGVMEIPTSEGLRASGVQLDVVVLDAMVMVDMALLASLEQDRKSRTQKLSTYLSTRFHHTLAP